MTRQNVLRLLEGGDRRSIGRADQIAAMVSRHPKLVPDLMEGFWSDDPLVRMRAADAAEKITRSNPELLRPYKSALLALMAEADQKELRWHLAVMLPRLVLNNEERRLAISLLHSCLEDGSSTVKTFALQGLADFARDHPDIRAEATETLRESSHAGTPAMKARSRKLLSQLDDL